MNEVDGSVDLPVGESITSASVAVSTSPAIHGAHTRIDIDIAKFLEMPYIKVYEVATFYTMYNLSPVGKYFVQVCTTTPCMIRGASKLVEACKEKISENENELSNNKNCSWMEVECLGACVNAPMMQINDDYYEDLDKEKTLEILDKILNGETPKPGSYRGRVSNQPENNRKTLMDLKNA